MNLLIVDDQYQVVEGMKRGINWKKLGIKQLFTALNSFQAKKLLEEHDISIVLCDIEMPGENGLELVQWINQKEQNIRSIILTAHADFSYAQDAVKLGCFDYILQPASYQSIEECVRKAIHEVRTSNQKDELEDMGYVYKQQEKNLVRGSLKKHILEIDASRQLAALCQRKKVPEMNQNIYLCMLQVVRWNVSEPWNQELIADTMENIAAEVFETNRMKVAVLAMEEHPCFAMFVWGDKLLEEDRMLCQLQFINSIYQQFIRCEITIYMEQAVSLMQSPKTWRKLKNRMDDNVSLVGGVYMQQAAQKKEFIYRIPEIRRWSGLLKDGYAQVVEEEAGKCLDKMQASGILSRKILREFYQDFLQAAYYAAETGDVFLRELFSTQDEFQLYLDGMRDIHQMKTLIHYVVERFDCSERNEEPKKLVEKTIKYIMEHLGEDMKRDDLAFHVHLNPDYLTRIFKKETGMTLKEFIIDAKMKEAQMLLRTTCLPVSIISAKVGYFNFSHFSYTYKKVMGVSPQDERLYEEEG